jgi:putative transposase
MTPGRSTSANNAASNAANTAGAVHVPVHLIWRVAANSPALTPEAVERLVPYVTRYAQTLGILVYAVGGTTDHLHILYDLTPTRTLNDVTAELQKTTLRFLRDVLNLRGFAWDTEIRTEGIGPENRDALTDYIRENAVRHAENRLEPTWEGDDTEESAVSVSGDELPAWLREVLPGG